MSPARRNARREAPATSTASWLPTGFVLLAGIAAYAAVASNALSNARLEFAEVGYLVKAWWYVSGGLAPFSAADALPTMPAFPFGLGLLQTQIGLSVNAARIAMIVLGAMNGAALFFLCRKLTANSLASAAAVLMFIGSPATAYSFSTASPVGLASLLHLGALWIVVLSVGRPKIWLSALMGLTLGLIVLTSAAMALPVLMLLGLFMAAAGSARWLHGAVAVIVIAALFGAAITMLPEQFTAFLLKDPLVALATGRPEFDLTRIGMDAYEGVLLPYGGTVMLCLLLVPLTLSGPRVFWIVPLYFLAALAAITVFRADGCEICAATAPSQVSAMGALGAAMTLAFLARIARQKNLSSAPLALGGVFLALALNTFGPVMAGREDLRSFPAEMLKQPRPAAELQDVTALMRFIGQNVPSGSESMLLLHDMPSIPYAVHMAGRRFAAVSLNPKAAQRTLAATLSGPRREAMLAATERNGYWTTETLRRWVERDYELILWQDGAVTMDQMIAALLETGFETVAVTDYRGAKLTLYRRKT
jgi:hypothetical protein